jgi:tetratricopeptide (TPR) repeat protein
MSQTNKKDTEKINSYSDKALLYDSKSDASLIAKDFYYTQIKECQLALPHLEKALEYHPNSSLAVQMLADFYFRLIPILTNIWSMPKKKYHLMWPVALSYTVISI